MTEHDFQLDREFVELHQLLKFMGLADSGGQGKAMVAAGQVRVGGEVELRKARKLRAGDRVEVGDVAIRIVAA
jgi:ribosome-associated protein